VIGGIQQLRFGEKGAQTTDARPQRARGLSVAHLAESLGVSRVSIYFWEGGRVRPRDANLSALCKALKLPIRRTREIAAG